MNYGRNRSKSFSKCSNEDFQHYYSTVVGNHAEFCLKGNYIFTNHDVHACL